MIFYFFSRGGWGWGCGGGGGGGGTNISDPDQDRSACPKFWFSAKCTYTTLWSNQATHKYHNYVCIRRTPNFRLRHFRKKNKLSLEEIKL